MKLLLTSSGISNKSIEKGLAELLGKPFSDSNLTFIPTAANIEEGDKTWLVKDLNNFRLLGFKSFEIVDIAVASSEALLKSINNADVLVFGGGNVSYLLSQIRASGLDENLADLLQSKVYVGISAGSMVTANEISLSTADMLYYEKTGEIQTAKGLGFVNFEIRPHLNDNYFPLVTLEKLHEIAEKTPHTFYALDDNSAIKIDDNGNVEVISEGEWEKFN